MNVLSFSSRFARTLGLLVLANLAIWPESSRAAIEETFAVLQIGTRTYRNVTVTTKAKNYIFIMHSDGMTNFKITELPPELRSKLGYSDVPKEKTGSAALSAWTKQTATRMHFPQLKQIEQQWRAHAPAGLATIQFTPNLLLTVGGIVFFLYLLMSYCSMLICQKTGNEPGGMIWVPFLQLIPLLRAAGMSPAWVLAFLVPVLNIIAQIVWSFSIAKARGKGPGIGLLLLLPLTALFAYFYLAFSSGAAKKEQRVVEVMTLECS